MSDTVVSHQQLQILPPPQAAECMAFRNARIVGFIEDTLRLALVLCFQRPTLWAYFVSIVADTQFWKSNFPSLSRNDNNLKCDLVLYQFRAIPCKLQRTFKFLAVLLIKQTDQQTHGSKT